MAGRFAVASRLLTPSRVKAQGHPDRHKPDPAARRIGFGLGKYVVSLAWRTGDDLVPQSGLFDQSPAHGLGHRRGAVGDAELAVEVLHVGAHSGGRQVQFRRDIGYRQSVGDQLDDLGFAG